MLVNHDATVAGFLRIDAVNCLFFKRWP